MRRSVLLVAAVALLTLLAVPGQAIGDGAETGKIQSVDVGGPPGFEVSAELDQDDFFMVVADWRGFPSGAWFRCAASDNEEDLMPTMHRQGLDTVLVSGLYEPSDFDQCDGNPDPDLSPEFWDISFEFRVVADMVSETYQSSTDTEKILKGEGENESCSTSRRIVRGTEGTVSGEVFGEEVDSSDSLSGGWSFGHWSEHGESC